MYVIRWMASRVGDKSAKERGIRNRGETEHKGADCGYY